MTRLATLVLALVLVAVPAAASDGKFDRATLKCLAGFWVLIEDFNDVARRAGFSEETFKTAAELKLRLAGHQGAHGGREISDAGRAVSVRECEHPGDRAGAPRAVLDQPRTESEWLLQRNGEFTVAVTWSKKLTGSAMPTTRLKASRWRWTSSSTPGCR